MTKKIVKSKEHCCPTRSKTGFFRHFVEKRPQKAVATLTQVAPDDQSRNDPQKMVKAVWQKNE